MILQNFLFPNENTVDEELLYVRHKDNVECFDTYFNVFSIAKWKEYTGIKEFYISLKTFGSGKLTILDENKELISKNVYGEEEIKIPDTDARLVYINWIPDSEGKIVSAAFTTKEEAKRDVRIAINTCTYKRENYIKRNVEVLKKEIVENKESLLYDKCFVYVIDNGRTLNEDEFTSSHVKVFKNINAGGSGGYTRGLLEVLNDKTDRKLTNVIFMDDDVVVQPESIYRTYTLLSYLKEEYKDSVIAGAMLRNETRYMQYECGARWDGMYIESCNKQYDLRDFDTVLKNEIPYDCDYAAWWYASYSLNVVRDDNLPMPFFIRFDDIEYGIRNKCKVLALNGICIWHESFEAKKSSALVYYEMRNCAIINAFENHSSRNKTVDLCFANIIGNTVRYKYRDNDVINKAIRDMLKGPKYFASIDPDEFNQSIRGIGCQRTSVTEPFALEPGKKDISKIKSIVTVYGWLLPADYSKTYCIDMYSEPRDFYRRGKLRLVNPESNMEYYGEKSNKEGLKSFWMAIKLQTKLVFNYERVCKEYRDSKAYLTSRRFWESYLKLNEK